MLASIPPLSLRFLQDSLLCHPIFLASSLLPGHVVFAPDNTLLFHVDDIGQFNITKWNDLASPKSLEALPLWTNQQPILSDAD